MNIFIMGGTAESIDIIKFIKKDYPDIYIITSTTTEYGANIAKEAGSDELISRPLPKEDILKVLDDYNIDLYIDATHPFAEHVTKTACNIVNEKKIPFIRFERESLYIEDIKNINLDNVYHVDSFDEAGKLIVNNSIEGNVLHLGGINTAESVLKYVPVDKFYIRVLTVKSSIDKCRELKIDENHIFPMTASKNKDKKISTNENLELYKKVNAKIILTKESGYTGGFREKIEAANKLNIKIIIVNSPKIKELEDKTVISTIEDFDKELNKIISN